eukprot:gene13607-19483_t
MENWEVMVAVLLGETGGDGQSEHGFFERSLDLEEADRGFVHIQLRYIPYF